MKKAAQPPPPEATRPQPPPKPPRPRKWRPSSIDSDLKSMMIDNARQAGYYKGLLEGLICQAVDRGGFYSIDARAFDKIKQAFEAFNNE